MFHALISILIQLLRMFILALPVLSSTPQHSFDITAGNDVALDCSTIAHPPPKVTWLKDGVVFSAPNVKFEQNDQVLKIEKTTLSDAGHYMCQVKNPVGEVYNEFDVTISGN